jgi:hypothetical protein
VNTPKEKQPQQLPAAATAAAGSRFSQGNLGLVAQALLPP